jgi:hypothetical protein
MPSAGESGCDDESGMELLGPLRTPKKLQKVQKLRKINSTEQNFSTVYLVGSSVHWSFVAPYCCLMNFSKVFSV